MAKIREVAVKRDKLILDEREKQQAIVAGGSGSRAVGRCPPPAEMIRNQPQRLKRPGPQAGLFLCWAYDVADTDVRV